MRCLQPYDLNPSAINPEANSVPIVVDGRTVSWSAVASLSEADGYILS
jgi:hypothetical protein